MRRTALPLAVVLVVALAGLAPPAAAPAAGSGGDASRRPPAARSRPTVPVPVGQVVDEVDITTVVPALQASFGARYGGYWIEGESPGDVMHVGVVGATDADRAAVADITDSHPRVATDAVVHGYDALLAAGDEIAASLDPAAGNFAVGVDVASNSVVVQTAEAAAGTQTVARHAARRGAARAAAARANAAARRGVPPAAPAAPAVPADVAGAVVIEPNVGIEIAPAGRTRSTFPPYELGLSITVHVGRARHGCTTGLMFRNGYGHFGSTAGHCGPVGSGVVIGSRLVDSIRSNGYYSARTVVGDAGLTSLSRLRWPRWAVIHTQGGGHRAIIYKLSNAQIAPGLRLCFEGVGSDGGNCGSVVRANQTLCCDAAGKTYVYSCTNYPGRLGDSGAPVYQPVGTQDAHAAGMLSSNVTVGGTPLMCFSTVNNLERAMSSSVMTVYG